MTISHFPLLQKSTKLFLAFFPFFSELCLGKAMVAYTKPQLRKREESGRLIGERDQIKFIYARFESWPCPPILNNCQISGKERG